MYALLRGVDGLSAGTRVDVLSNPIVTPVHVRTIGKVPTVAYKRWKDQYGVTHSDSFIVSQKYVELEVPCDNLVKLRARTR